MKISNADLKFSNTGLNLKATAIAPTLGWKNVSLNKIEYINPPEDGMQEVILFAYPPDDIIVLPIVDVFSLSIELDTPEWFQGVRIINAFNDQQWALRKPVINQEHIGKDPFTVNHFELSEDKLFINVVYSGGLKKHSFQLNWDGSIEKSLPPQVLLELTHNKNGDTGKALISETLQFDLSVLVGLPEQEMKLIIKAPYSSLEISYIPMLVIQNLSALSESSGGVVGNG